MDISVNKINKGGIRFLLGNKKITITYMLQVIQSKTPRGCLKPQTVLNPKYVFPTHTCR